MARKRKTKVVVLYNFVGEDEFETLRDGLIKGETELSSEMAEEFAPEAIGEEISTVDEEIQAVAKALLKQGFSVNVINVLDDFDTLLKALTDPRPDVVFNLVEWFNDDAWQEDRVASLYDLLRIPYTGSPPITLATCQRKARTKQILLANGIPTPRFKLVTKEPIPRLSGLRYPVIVKPSRADASEGVSEDSVVDDRGSLEAKVREILADYEQPALIEDFIPGRELGVSILGNDPPRALPPEEMDFTDLPEKYRGIISFESKWDPLAEVYHKAELICPADLPKSVERRARELAIRSFQVMGCLDYARIDMRLDKRNRLFVLEVNPNPDISESVGFMASAQAGGLSFGRTLKKIVQAALKRKGQVS